MTGGHDLLYGRRAVAEALRGRRRLKRLLLAEGVREDDRLRRLVAAAQSQHLTVERLPRVELDRLTGPANHQGVALEASPYPYLTLDELLARRGTMLILDHLQDPQNFGTLLRAADATGVTGVVLAQDRAVDVTPAVVNASAGAVEHLPVCRTPNIARAMEAAKAGGWWCVGLDSAEDAVDLFRAALPEPLALIVGGEGTGLGANVRRHCDLIVAIPMVGRVASLNAATAGSVALFELFRRQREAAPARE